MASFNNLNDSFLNSTDHQMVFRDFFDHAFDGFEIVDSKKDVVVEISDKLLALLELERDNVIGASPMRLIQNQQEEKDENFVINIKEQIRLNGSFKYTRKHLKSDGTVIDLELLCFALAPPVEHLVVVLFKNNSINVQAQDALRESEKRFRLIFNNAFDGLYFFNYKKQELILANSKLFELFETTHDRILIDKPHLKPEIQPDGTRTLDNILKGLKETLETGRSRASRVYYKNDGTEVHLEISTFLLSPPDDDLIVSIYKDITDQKLAERTLIENATQRQKMEAMKRELTSFALFTTQKNKLLQELESDVKDLRSLSGDTLKFGLEKILKRISSNLNNNENWLSFKLQFERVHPGFFNNLRLKYGDLSSNEQKHCAYIKMNLSNGEIADLLFVGKKAIEMSHYRIKKRLGLPKELSLKVALSQL